jgi:hypothetical protein
MTRSPISLAPEQLRTRLEVIKGVVGQDDKSKANLDVIKEARRLADEVSLLLDQAADRQLKAEQANAVSAKMTASETLVLDRLPIPHLLSGLRDSCTEILTLTNRATGEYAMQERTFAAETLKQLNSGNTLSEEAVRTLYLQARQRLDSVLAGRLMLIQVTHRLITNLWLRTATAALICSIPVIIFVYERCQIPWSDTTQTGSSLATAPAADIDAQSAPAVSASPASNMDAESEPAVTTTPPAIGDATEKGLAAGGNTSSGQASTYERKQALIPIARLAALFSVIIMGMLGGFVSNYSRVCALLKEAAPLGILAADRSIRVRFSPFVGGLLAFALSEVFGAHLVQGDLFPMTENMHQWTDFIWSGTAYPKLLVWAFVAGLSEDYVLRTLGSLATRVGFAGKSGASEQSAE